MSRFIKNILLFLFLISALLTVINLFQAKYNFEPPHYKLQYNALYEQADLYNALIIGTSHATHSFRPSILDSSGIKFYNFSLNGSNPEFYINWFSELFVKHNVKTEYCIVSVDNYFFGGAGWRRFEQDSEYFPRNIFLRLLTGSNKINRTELLLNRFPVFKYRIQLKHSLQLKKGDDRYIANQYDRGFIPYEIPYNPERFTREERKDRIIPEKRKNDFTELLTIISSSAEKIVLVIPPEHDLSSVEYSSLKKYIGDIANTYSIPFFDFNNKKRYPDLNSIEYFSDKSHMNSKGSKVFSKLFAKELQQLTEH